MHRKGGEGGFCVGRGSRHRLMKFYFSIKIYCSCDLCSPKGERPPQRSDGASSVFVAKKKSFSVFIFVLCFVEFLAVPPSFMF